MGDSTQESIGVEQGTADGGGASVQSAEERAARPRLSRQEANQARQDRGRRFLENYAGAVLKRPVVLHDRETQILFKRAFEYAMMCTNDALSVSMRALGDAADTIHQEVESTLRNSMTLLLKEEKKIRLAVNGIQLNGTVEYNLKKEEVARITHPLGNVLVDILLKLDEIVLLLSAMWFAGKMSDREKRERIQALRVVYYNTVMGLRGLRGRVYNAVQERRVGSLAAPGEVPSDVGENASEAERGEDFTALEAEAVAAAAEVVGVPASEAAAA